MFDKKEVVSMVLVSIFLGFSLSIWYFLSSATGTVEEFDYFFIFLMTFGFIFLIILINVLAKKIAAYYFDSELRVRIWEIKRWGYKPSHYFRNPFYAGIIIPIVTAFISLGYFVWLSPLVFDVKSKSSRVSKRHGSNTYYDMNESHVGLIAVFGLLVSLFSAIIGYLIGFSEFSRLSLYFIIFNLLPFSDLDGTKVFFGNKILWFIMFIISIVAVLFGIMFL